MHGEGILGCLKPDFTCQGRLAMLDARETLAELLLDGMPDCVRFQKAIGGAVESARAASERRQVRVFTEMVDVARRASLDLALSLEVLWAEFLNTQRIALVCGYSIDTFDPESYRGLLQRVTSAHSHVVPVEDYRRLDRAVRLA